MLRPITLENLAPVGDETPINCIVSYPCETAGTVELVSYDGAGRERETMRVRASRVTARLIAKMVSKIT